MLDTWISHCYSGSCQFGSDNGMLLIHNDDPGGKAAWFAYMLGDVFPGETISIVGQHTGGVVIVQYFAGDDWLQGVRVTPPDEVIIPDIGADKIRLLCRLNGPGTAVFQDIDLVGPNLARAGLEIPPPVMAQKHHVTGWKWGRNISLMVHDDDLEPPNYLDEDSPYDGVNLIPYEVRGFQHGRRLDLEIGNMHVNDEEEE